PVGGCADRASTRASAVEHRETIGPRRGPFDLSGQAQQQRLVVDRADELDADGKSFGAPVQRQRHRRLTTDVELRGELQDAREPFGAELGVAQPADRRWWYRDDGTHEDVELVPPCLQPT